MISDVLPLWLAAAWVGTLGVTAAELSAVCPDAELVETTVPPDWEAAPVCDWLSVEELPHAVMETARKAAVIIGTKIFLFIILISFRMGLLFSYLGFIIQEKD